MLIRQHPNHNDNNYQENIENNNNNYPKQRDSNQIVISAGLTCNRKINEVDVPIIDIATPANTKEHKP